VLWEWLGPALGLVFAAAPAFFWRGTYVDVEALRMLRHYWGEGSFLQKVFDPRSVDYYRARELSYAADFLDAQWVRLLAERDVFFFLAPTAVLASLALVALGWRLLPRALPGLGASARWLGLLALPSNFVFLSTMGIYYRSTKPLVAPLVLGLLLLALAEHRRPTLTPRLAFAAVFGTALAASLLDRVVASPRARWPRSGPGSSIEAGWAPGSYA
jgi:hypothetical protein